MVSTSVRKACACAIEIPEPTIGVKIVETLLSFMKKVEPGSSTSRRGARAAYQDEYPRDFGPQIAYTVS